VRIRRRTAAALCALALLLSAAGGLALALRPSYLRERALDAIRARLAGGFDAELDGVSYDLWRGLVMLEGFRLLRTAPEREVLVNIPHLEAETRLWALVAHGAVTEVRASGPKILVERTKEGRFPLLEAFGAAEAPGQVRGPRPGIAVTGGTLRLRDDSVLAAGEEVDFAVEFLRLEESRGGGPSALNGVLWETGSPLHPGSGALGRVVLRGEVPLSRPGLRMLVDRFEWNQPLLDRLAPALRERLAVLSLEGTFGEGPEVPGLEVVLREAPGGAPSAGVIVRPRGVGFLVKALPINLTDARGEVQWRDGGLAIHDLSARYDAAEFHLDGHVEDLGPDATGKVAFWARDLYLDQGLRNALPPSVQRVWDAYALSGVVDVTAAPPGTPGSFDSSISRDSPDAPFRCTVEARLRDGEMSYRGYLRKDGMRSGFDWPLTGVTGAVHVDADGGSATVTLSEVRGRHGAVEVTAHGTVKELGPRGAEVAVIVECDGLPLDDDVRLASRDMERLFARFGPQGTVAHLKVQVDQVADLDDGAYESVFLDLDGRASFCYAERLPLRIHGVSGRVEHRKDRVGDGHLLTVELRGLRGTTADGGRIGLDGSVEGSGDAHLRLSLRAADLLLDGELERALRAGGPHLRHAVAVWDRARPGGLADLSAEIGGTESRSVEEYVLTLREASAQGWGDLRFPAAGLTGTVEVKPDAVVLRGIRGTTGEGAVSLDGAVHDPAGESVLDLRIRAQDFPLDESLRDRLGEAAGRVQGYFSTVRPAPGLRGDLDILLRGKASGLEPVIVAEDIRGGIAPLGLRNLDVAGGSARYEGEVATVKDLAGSMADREFTVREGRFDLRRGEGSLDLEVRRLRFPRDLLGLLTEETVAGLERLAPDRYFHVDHLRVALSEEWRKVALEGVLSLSPVRPGATGGLGLEGIFDLHDLTFLRGPAEGDPVALSGWMGVESGVLTTGVRIAYLKGRLDLEGTLGGAAADLRVRLSEATARVEDRPLTGASADMAFTREEFRLTNLRGTLAGGDVGGSFRSGEGKPVYEGKFTLSGAHARLLFAPGDPESPLRGRVSATIEIVNPTGQREDLGGRGRVDVQEARLGRVPVFESLHPFLLIPDAPEFTSATLEFDLKGDRMRVTALDLDSSVLALHKAGGGSFIWLDGRLDVRLTPEYKFISSLPVIGGILDLLGGILKPVYERTHTIHVTGTIRQPVPSQQVLTGLFSSGPKDRPRMTPPAPASTVKGRPVWDF